MFSLNPKGRNNRLQGSAASLPADKHRYRPHPLGVPKVHVPRSQALRPPNHTKSPTDYLLNRIILVTCGCKPFFGRSCPQQASRNPQHRNHETNSKQYFLFGGGSSIRCTRSLSLHCCCCRCLFGNGVGT